MPNEHSEPASGMASVSTDSLHSQKRRIMSGNSTLDPDNYPGGPRASDIPPGHDTRSLGPSDSSDSGSDME